LVEQGLMDVNDQALKERLESTKLVRQAAVERVRLLNDTGNAGPAAITTESITRLSASLRQALQNDDPPFRKAYLRLFVGEVVVGDNEIRLSGPPLRWQKQRPLRCSRHRLPQCPVLFGNGVPCGIRTRVAAVRGT
jgi:hypothetical protein